MDKKEVSRIVYDVIVCGRKDPYERNPVADGEIVSHIVRSLRGSLLGTCYALGLGGAI